MKRVLLGWAVMAAVVFAAFVIGVLVGAGTIRKEAIDHGAARWVCDPATGETKFEWNK